MNLANLAPLALILFAPWFLVLSLLFWCYPRQPRPRWRRWFDGGTLLLAFAACLAALQWSMGVADRSHGALWPQILATSVGYGVFLAVLGLAWWSRQRRFRADGGATMAHTRPEAGGAA